MGNRLEFEQTFSNILGVNTPVMFGFYTRAAICMGRKSEAGVMKEGGGGEG